MIAFVAGLLLAHILIDFIFQTESMVENKLVNGWKSITLLFHVLGAGILAALLCMQWNIYALWIGAVTTITHYLIDGLKISWQKYRPHWQVWLFFTDQFAHLLVITGLAIWIISPGVVLDLLSTKHIQNGAISLTGYIFLLKPTSVVIQQLVGRWEITQPNNYDDLPSAGAWIGYLERTLIFIFIMADTFTVIGFLIAAKSILRFRDASNKRQITEYILLGTLLSFTIAIVVSVATRYFININFD